MYKDFNDYIKILSPKLRGIAHKLNGHFSYVSEEDLFQEAIVHLWMAFEKNTLSDKTDSYILQGCYFHIKNYLRKVLDKADIISLNAVLDDNSGYDLEDILPTKNDSNLKDIDASIILESLSKRGMTEKEAKVLSFIIDGLTTREIGQKLGVSHVMVVKIVKHMRDKYAGLKKSFKGGYQN